MVVTYYHVKPCILQIIILNWYYRPLVRSYENTMFLIGIAHKLVHRWVSCIVDWNKIVHTWDRYCWLVQSCKIESHYLLRTFEEVGFIHGCYVLPCKDMYSSDGLVRFAVNSKTVLKLVLSYRSLGSCYETRCFWMT